MSMYRFESAFIGLQDCYNNMPEDVDELSESELGAYKSLVVLCQKIADEYSEVAK